MSYEGRLTGRVAADGFQVRKGDDLEDFWTYQAVEERLVDAMRCWRRAADPEARFGLKGRISSLWQQYVPDRADLTKWGSLVDLEAQGPRPLPLSRADIARMTEAADWLRHVPEADRQLVVLALGKLASGHAQVPWLRLKRALGVKFGADGLRMRYSRALARIAKTLNRAENREDCVSR